VIAAPGRVAMCFLVTGGAGAFDSFWEGFLKLDKKDRILAGTNTCLRVTGRLIRSYSNLVVSTRVHESLSWLPAIFRTQVSLGRSTSDALVRLRALLPAIGDPTRGTGRSVGYPRFLKKNRQSKKGCIRQALRATWHTCGSTSSGYYTRRTAPSTAFRLANTTSGRCSDGDPVVVVVVGENGGVTNGRCNDSGTLKLLPAG
jgi:hypothetical protein